MAVAEAPPSDAVYYPQVRQFEWHQCPAYESGYGGAKGGGKTLALLAEAYRGVWHPRYRGVIFRRTYPRLQEVLDRAWQWFPKRGGHWQGDQHRWVFPSGATISMRHCQYEEDKYQYNGHEYHFIGFDQLEEFTATQYPYLLAQNRSGVAGIRAYTRSTFNPGGVGHAWVKEHFVDRGTRDCDPWFPENEEGDPLPSRCFHFATIEDNPALEAADPTYRARLDMLPEEERRALKLGDWDVFAGQVFSEWRRSKHVIDPIPLDPSWRQWGAVDYGSARPFVHLGLCQNPATLRVYITWEISKAGVLPASNQAKAILADAPDFYKPRFTVADPAMWIKQADTGYSIAEIYARAGVLLTKASNDRLSGLARFREFLADDEDGRPMLQVFSTCRQLIKNIPSLVRDQHRVEDVDSDGPDDEYDAARYGVMAAHWFDRSVRRPNQRMSVRSGSIRSGRR